MKTVVVTLWAVILLLGAVPTSAQRGDFASCKESTGYSGKFITETQRRELNRLQEPYADGIVTQEELDWMRRYKSATGDTYTEGSLLIMQRLDACLSGDKTTKTEYEADGFAEECARLAVEWDQEFGLDASKSAIASGCRVDAEGVWFFPTSEFDPRFPGGSLLSETERAQTVDIRAQIEHQLAGLPAAFPDYLWEAVQARRDNTRKPLYGFTRSDAARPYPFSITEYEGALLAYLRNPDHVELLNYAGWFMQWQWSALSTYCAVQPAVLCTHIMATLNFDPNPWPWELEDPITIAEYLKWLTEHSNI